MGLPDVLMTKVDEYVDSLAPQIQPRIASELEDFQQMTIDSLETQVIDAFRSLFNKDKPTSSDGSRGPWNLNDSAPDAYGGQSLPFASEIASLTRSFTQISDEAGSDVRDIFDLTENRGGSEQSRSLDGDSGGGARGFLSSAFEAVQSHLDDNQREGGQSLEIGGFLGSLSGMIKDATQNPEEKARLISPDIKRSVGEKLRMQHAPIAEQFTRIALDHLKRWLRGNTSTSDLGDGAKAEIADQVGDLVKGLGGLFGGKKSSDQESSRGFDESNQSEGGGGFSRTISDKLSTGLAKVHREVRLEFRKVLGEIEKQLFELLPDQFQGPLEKILGGNPFDSELDRDASGTTDRGFGEDIKTKLLGKIRALVQKMQETLRESILGVVNGGHRRFERQSWVFVQSMVEEKVQRYLPDVKIEVPDDIGNENVSVGAPTPGTQMGGGYQPPPPGGPQMGGDYPPQQHQNEYRADPDMQQDTGYRPPPPQDDFRGNAEYRGDSSMQRNEEYQRPPQGNEYYQGGGPQMSGGYQRPQEHNEYYQNAGPPMGGGYQPPRGQDEYYADPGRQMGGGYQAPPSNNDYYQRQDGYGR